jgi:hypothetical protein
MPPLVKINYKMKRSLALAMLLVSGIYACNSDQKAGNDNQGTQDSTAVLNTDTLSYTYDSIKVYSKQPISANKNVTDTAKAVVKFPLFKNAAANKFVKDMVIGQTGQEENYRTYKELASGFIKEFDDYKAINVNSTETWFQLLNIRVISNYPNYISMLHTYSEYKGGAHANTLFTYFNYNPESLQTITLDSLITSDGMPKLRAVAENIFRKNEQLAPNASLSEGYFFTDGIFSLAQTFTVTRDGIKFLYNPDEIKNHAAGTTELIVPFTKIRDILKPSSILQNFN